MSVEAFIGLTTTLALGFVLFLGMFIERKRAAWELRRKAAALRPAALAHRPGHPTPPRPDSAGTLDRLRRQHVAMAVAQLERVVDGRDFGAVDVVGAIDRAIDEIRKARALCGTNPIPNPPG